MVTEGGAAGPMNTVQYFLFEQGQDVRVTKNRLVLAALAGTLVWLADQPTLKGYNPLIEMFWDPGIFRAPAHDRMVLLLSWLVTTLFCHFVLFAFQRTRQRGL